MKEFEPEKVIWDINDLNENPPWGNNISDDITSLANYFVTSDGKNLIELTIEALNYGIKVKKDITVINI